MASDTENNCNTNMIAYCGLYCAECVKYKNDKCGGCKEGKIADWCRIRGCCIENGFKSCADCDKNVKECRKFSNFISKLFALIFKSDRPSSIAYIREHGYDAYATQMCEKKQKCIKK